MMGKEYLARTMTITEMGASLPTKPVSAIESSAPHDFNYQCCQTDDKPAYNRSQTMRSARPTAQA